jgi:hypothetical protein
MATRSRLRRRVFIPNISTQKSQTKDYEFKKGYNSNLSNDEVDIDQLRYVTDAREIEIGKWETRKGADFFSVPIGEAVNVEQTSTTGASSFDFATTAWFAKKIVATGDGRLTSIEARLKTTDGTGTVVLALFTDDAGAPGDELMRTTIAASSVAGSYAYLKGRSITCPDITNATTYWVVGFVQQGGTGGYQISTTTNASTGLSSTNSGQTWEAANLDFNVKLSTATAGGVKGHIDVRKSDGTIFTFFAHGTILYKIDQVTGATTSVDSGISGSSTSVRFAFVNDVLYYATSYQKPRKYDFSAAAEVTGAPEFASDVIEYKGLVFYSSAVDPTKVFWSNFGAYETFTSTDFLNVPAPKTSDPITGFAKLNGVLYVTTYSNKYVLYGAQSATFRLEEAVGQQGAFPGSIVYDHNYIFVANKDGIWQFNGAEEKNIAEDILAEWSDLLDKDNTVLHLFDNRLYAFTTSNGSARNNQCFVRNLLYGIWESLDLNMYVAGAFSRSAGDRFLLASNLVGMVMLSEQSTNDYNNMGEPLTLELRTNYHHYDSPAQHKRAPVYRPHFDTVPGRYSVQVGYATDYSDAPTFADIPLAGTGPRFDEGYLFDDGNVFGGSAQVNPMDDSVQIPGEWRRLQLRYMHYAAREPVSFDGHVLAIETQRLI